MEPPHTYLSRLAQAGDLLFAKERRQQFAAICYRKAGNGCEVLLVTTRGSGRWVVPKGWPIRDKAPQEVAEQEAFEEAGVKGKAGWKPVGHYTYAKQLQDGRIAPCLVEVYAVKVEKVARKFKEHGQRERRWVSFTDAPNLVVEPDVRGLIMPLAAILGGERQGD